jgi:hypothetical protein
MARSKPLKLCPICEKALTGCACGHRRASDGTMVHSSCLPKYENFLNKQRASEQKKRKE